MIGAIPGLLHGLLSLDLGRTIITRAPVADIVAMPLRNSMALAAVTLLLACRWPRHRHGGRAGEGARTGQCGLGRGHHRLLDPGIRHGPAAIAVFAVWWPIFPATITASTDDPLSILLAAAPLAVATTIIGSIAYLGRILRVGMVEVMAADFVERLHLSGIPRWRIVWLHALPAAVIRGCCRPPHSMPRRWSPASSW